MKKPAPLGVVILAGGRGQRMGGQDKGWLNLNDQPIITHLLSQWRQSFAGPIVISANRNLADYQALGCLVVTDESVPMGDSTRPYQGPLVGILAAMQTELAEKWLTWPVDAPRLPNWYFNEFANKFNDPNNWLVESYQNSHREPLHIGVDTCLKSHLIDYLKSGQRSVGEWCEDVKRHYPSHLAESIHFQQGVFNLNTPQDWFNYQQGAK
ncbi:MULTISPECIES: molybdenum cofactor guanylyltransferase [Thiomicrospira]|uniref:Molybdenum cofactor guanylyltransferase n=1 Tax=Thiomicrospira aerophila AL3 TaxID=717772 RepID=W0DS30_9GAMM|nr:MULTISPECIES: NTP transferase domain-containing protein [Thiomicrospira]AHF01242.1 molybdopterin-guanine dinucleotide biosynthesis protein A [Thiomicrospira aerophila AL3]SFR49987.1 molybdopterin-guanine dinucleotide biosynthesis protein A [Thiomicrospira sp. ALE5]